MRKYDLIVIGTGSMGASACYHASKQGFKVLGIDQFKPPHSFGSHNGQSRIVRKAYFEHPDYVPLLQRAYEHWDKLEEESEKKLFIKTGLVYFGSPHGALLTGVQDSAHQYQIRIEEKDKSQFPEFSTPPDYACLFEEDAGFAFAETTINTLLELARKQGADFQQDRVESWETFRDYVKIVGKDQSYLADKIIVCAGAFTKDLIADQELQITEQSMIWVKPNKKEIFMSDTFPCWNVELNSGGLMYGFPYQDTNQKRVGLKLAYHHPGKKLNSAAKTNDISKEDQEFLLNFLKVMIPNAYGEILHSCTCLYTNSKDENFIIDRLNNTNDRIVYACGFSGHGFKFVPVIGEILVDLAQGKASPIAIEFLSSDRFKRKDQR